MTRTTLTWGYKDDKGAFKGAGVADFDHAGGVLHGEIAPGSSPTSIEVKVAIDYASPDITDLEYVLTPKVSESGAVAIVQTTSNFTNNVFALSVRTWLSRRDYLVFSYGYTTSGGAQPPRTQKGTVFLDHNDLVRAQHTYFARRLSFPVRDSNEGEIAWTLSGLLNDQPVATRGTFKLTEPTVLVVAGPDGTLTAHPPTATASRNR